MGVSDIKFHQNEFSEKRTSPRSPVFIAVNYSIAGRVRTDFIRNISDDGVFIETHESMSEGQDITMTFKHPGSQDHRKIGGRVVRIDPPGVGVKFFKGQPGSAKNGKNLIEDRKNQKPVEGESVRILSAIRKRLRKEEMRDKYGKVVFETESQQEMKVAAKKIRKRDGSSQPEALKSLQSVAKEMPDRFGVELHSPSKGIEIKSHEKVLLPLTVDDKYLHHNFGPRPRKMDFGPGAEFFKSATQFFRSNDYEKAVPLFKNAIDKGLEPEIMASAYCHLGVIAVKEKNFRIAIEDFLKCLEAPFRIDTDVFRAATYLRIIFSAANHVAGADKFERLCKAARTDRPGKRAVAPRSQEYRSFEKAREFAQGLGLKSQSEWRRFCKGGMPDKGARPKDIPVAVWQVYKDKGWAGMGDWLGTGRIADRLKKFRPFQEAREFTRSLGLRNNNEWRRFCKGGMPEKGLLPEDIPADPRKVYKDKGWAGMGDWLGTGAIALRLRKFRSFESALEFARSLGLRSEKEWRSFCKGEMPEKGLLPEDIPADPRKVYQDKGWAGMGDWLGTGTIALRLKKFRSFEEAREFVQGIGLKSQAEWKRFCKGEMPEKGFLPKDIPAAAWHIYKDEGWAGMRDWLGIASP
jgi:TolA-binding protein